MFVESLQVRLHARLEQSLLTRGAPGTAAAVCTDEGVLWKGAHAPDQEHVSDNDVFLIYSLTKTFIAFVVLKLTQIERIELDSTISHWLPDLPFAHQVTVRQLLNHTSGLPDYGAMASYQQSLKSDPSHPWSQEEFFSYSLGGRLQFPPGSGWAYSNIGYMFLRLLLERVAGTDFASVMSEHVFKPLALDSAFVPVSIEDLRTLTPGHSRYLARYGQPADVRELYHPGWVATGVIAANACDVARFYYALLTGQLLTAESMIELRKLVRLPERHKYFRNPSYGLGLMADPDFPGGPLYGHTGDGPGYCSAAYVSLGHYLAPAAVAVLCNAEGADRAEGIALDLLRTMQD